MAQKDWLVCERYGQFTGVAAGSTANLPLLPAPDFAAIDPGVPDDDAFDILIHRIVGQVWVSTDVTVSDSVHNFGWRIWPMALDETAIGIDTPFINFNMLDEDHANLRWWGERMFYNILPNPGGLVGYGMDPFAHPYWTEIDLHPNQWVGQKSRVWPVLSFDNNNLNDSLRVHNRLRMWVSYR